MIRPCPNYMRHTETDCVPAEAIQEPYYEGSVRKLKTVTVIPGYSVCTFCGWCYGYDNEQATA